MSPLASVFEPNVVRVMTGMAGVPGGTSHSCVTATMSAASPRANRMSVALGSSEQILMASLASARSAAWAPSVGTAGGSLADDGASQEAAALVEYGYSMSWSACSNTVCGMVRP